MVHDLTYPHTERSLAAGEVDPTAWAVLVEGDDRHVVGPCPICGAPGQEARVETDPHPVERSSDDVAARALEAAPVEVALSCTCGAPHGVDRATGCGAQWALAVGEAGEVAALSVRRDDVAAVRELANNERVRLESVRSRAGKWLAALSGAATLLGTVAVLVGPPQAAELDASVRSVIGTLVVVALAALAGATVQAAQAGFGELGGGPELAATPVRGAARRWQAARRRAAELALARLRLAVVLGLTGLGVALLAALIAWFHVG